MIGGFEASRSYLIEASPDLLDSFLYRFLVQAAALKKGVMVVECGSSFNPYEVSRESRTLNLDPVDVLTRIFISRPFTAYQLNTLFEEKLPSVMKRISPGLLVFSHLPELFLSSDVTRGDAKVILERVAGEIKRMDKEDLILLVTSWKEHGFPGESPIKRIIDTTITFYRKDPLIVIGLRDILGERWAEFLPSIPHQKTLDEF